MSFFIITGILLLATVFIVHYVANTFGFRLFYIPLFLSALLALGINFMVISMDEVTATISIVKIFLTVLFASAFVTVVNDILISREKKRMLLKRAKRRKRLKRKDAEDTSKGEGNEETEETPKETENIEATEETPKETEQSENAAETEEETAEIAPQRESFFKKILNKLSLFNFRKKKTEIEEKNETLETVEEIEEAEKIDALLEPEEIDEGAENGEVGESDANGDADKVNESDAGDESEDSSDIVETVESEKSEENNNLAENDEPNENAESDKKDENGKSEEYDELDEMMALRGLLENDDNPSAEPNVEQEKDVKAEVRKKDGFINKIFKRQEDPTREKVDIAQFENLDQLLDFAYEAKASGRYDEAIDVYEGAIEKYEDDSYLPFLIIDLGNVYKALGEYNIAIDIFEKALNMPNIKDDPSVLESFEENLTYLGALKIVLRKHKIDQKPFTELDDDILKEIDAALNN